MIFNPIFIQDYSGSSQLKQNGLRFQAVNYLFADIINVYENESNVDSPQLNLEKSIGKNLFSLDGKDIIKVSAEELISFFETFPGKLEVIDSDKTLTDRSVTTISDSKNISVDALLNQLELKGKIEIVSSEKPDKILLITINQITDDKSGNNFLMNIKPNSSSIVSLGQDNKRIDLNNLAVNNFDKNSNNVSELLNKLKLNYSRIKSEKRQSEDKDFAIENSSEKQELLALLNQIAEEIVRDNSMKHSFLFSEIKEVLDEIKKELSMSTSPDFDEIDEQVKGSRENDLINASSELDSKNRVKNVFDKYKAAISDEYTSINSETREKFIITKPTIENETLDLKKVSDGTEFQIQGNEKTSTDLKNNFAKTASKDGKYEQGKVDDLGLNKIQLKEKPVGAELETNNEKGIGKPSFEKGIVVEKDTADNEIQLKETKNLLLEIEINNSRIAEEKEKRIPEKINKNDLSKAQLKEHLTELDSKIGIKNISKRNNESLISSEQRITDRRINGESGPYKESKTDFDLSNAKSEVNPNANSSNIYSSKVEVIKTKIDLLINQIRNQERPDSKIKLSLDAQANQFDKGIINKEINADRVIKRVVEADTISSNITDLLNTKKAQKNSAITNSDESKLKYSIHIIENQKIGKMPDNNLKGSNNIPAGIKEVQIQKSFEEVKTNLSFSKKLFESNGNYESKVQLESVSNDERQKIDSDLIIHEVEKNESITSIKKNEHLKSLTDNEQKNVKNILRANDSNIPSKNSFEGSVTNNKSSEGMDSETVEDIPNTIAKEVNIHQSSLSKNETTINNSEVKNNRKHSYDIEDLHLSERNKNGINVSKSDGSEKHYEQQGRNNDKNTADSIVRNLNGMNEKPLDFIRDLKNNLENISDPLKNHPVEIIKNIREYELKNELKNLFNTNESKNITLKLSPENLGKVNIELDITENLMQAKINVESESVKTLIQSSAGELKNSLMQNGIQLMSMSVSMNNADEKGHSKNSGKTKRRINNIDETNSYDEIQNNEQTKNLGYNTYDLIM